jgi:hypothetical protein
VLRAAAWLCASEMVVVVVACACLGACEVRLEAFPPGGMRRIHGVRNAMPRAYRIGPLARSLPVFPACVVPSRKFPENVVPLLVLAAAAAAVCLPELVG